MTAASKRVMAHVMTMADKLESEMEKNPKLRAQAVMFVQRLSMIKKRGMVPGVGTAPYYIVVAERRGFPPVELQSLAHCLENMWLKATALDLGFHIVSITQKCQMIQSSVRFLGFPPANGC